MNLSDFDYALPPELIAKEPVRPRDASRMMVVNTRTGKIIDSDFRSLPGFLAPSDVVVFNNTRVLRARLYGKLTRPAGRRTDVEVLFAAPVSIDHGAWQVMCRPGKRIRAGDQITFGDGEVEGIFGELLDDGLRLLRLNSPDPVENVLEKYGHVPLPPYIDRAATDRDAAEYQTVYAENPGAIAAPTAGLHFTREMLAALGDKGVQTETITLHVGTGTFTPVRHDDPEKHVLKPERFEITAGAAARLNAARSRGQRIIAIGTTTTRTLEYLVSKHGQFNAGKGETDLFILPGYRFQAVDALLTNFHLPRSTLLMLVSAFASTAVVKTAYRRAVELGYRFYSYGDCMLLLR